MLGSKSLIAADVLEDSISREGNRLITFILQMPKFLDAEFEKHRMLSSNSSSSRAISFKRALTLPVYIPQDVRKEKKGMQGFEQLSNYDQRWFNEKILKLRSHVGEELEILYEQVEAHKQHLNRYLEPWTLQTKVVTGNLRWFQYFFGLRSAEYADPNIQELSNKMQHALDISAPRELKPGQWHMPLVADSLKDKPEFRLISAGRCARVSYGYTSFDNFDAEDDIRLAKKLLRDKHFTPFEHQATPMKHTSMMVVGKTLQWEEGVTHMDREYNLHSGNFAGFIQHRQLGE